MTNRKVATTKCKDCDKPVPIRNMETAVWIALGKRLMCRECRDKLNDKPINTNLEY